MRQRIGQKIMFGPEKETNRLKPAGIHARLCRFLGHKVPELGHGGIRNQASEVP